MLACIAAALGKQEYKHIEVVPFERCEDMNHLQQFFQTVMDRGGEGIILRDPKAVLTPGRSPGYLKHKVPFVLFFGGGGQGRREYPCADHSCLSYS